MHDLLQISPAQIFIHKVSSHDDEAFCVSPIEDFCRFWNNCADLQASVANCERPDFFRRVWSGFVGYRDVWKKRVQLYNKFVLAVAAVDCCTDNEQQDEGCTDEQRFPHFDVCTNSMQVVNHLRALIDRQDLFSEVHSHCFQTVFHRLTTWLAEVDSNAATMRQVSLLELYVGFRIGQPGKAPLVSGGGVVCKYSPVTFAVDFSFFKKVFHHLVEISGMQCFCGTILLPEINVLSPQPSIQVGWEHGLEVTVFEALIAFIRQRPITNAQSLSRPWQP